MRSGVVLVGGLSTRFDDGDKSRAELDGIPMARRVFDAIAPAVDEMVLVARDEEQAAELDSFDAEVAVDTVEEFGPVAGLHAGFGAASGELCFLSACDTPLIRTSVVETLFDRCGDGFDGAVPSNGYLEPLTAVYRRESMQEAAESAMGREDHRIIELYRDMGPIRMVPKEDLRSVDPELESFLNVNTVEDMKRARTILEDA